MNLPLTQKDYNQIFVGLLQDLHQIRAEVNRLENIISELKMVNETGGKQ